MKKFVLLASLTLCVTGLALAALADGAKPVKPYTLKTCIVSGEKLGEMGDPVTITNDGRQIKFCCDSCIAKFKKNPARFTKKIEEQEKKAAAK